MLIGALELDLGVNLSSLLTSHVIVQMCLLLSSVKCSSS